MTEKDFISKINTHEGIIQKLLYLYVTDPDDKQDLYQEIVFQAWKSIGRFKGDSKFSTWLYRLSFNTILTFNRKASRLPKGKYNEAMPVHEPIAESSSNSQRLLQVIKALNDVDKSIITLHLEEYKNEEISDMLGITKSHLAVKLHRIKEHIKAKLNPHG